MFSGRIGLAFIDALICPRLCAAEGRARGGGVRLSVFAAAGLLFVFVVAACAQAANAPKLEGRPYLDAARKFADTVLRRGRDTYGPQKTPLFVDGLHAESLEPVRWQRGGETWVLSNCGGQLSYRKEDRAQEALGHVHPTINEAKIVASYHQTSRYHDLPLVQMQAAESLAAAGGKCAEVGRDLLRWALEDLKVYARACYDPKSGKFIAMMTDGTPLKWQEAKTGYYVPESFAPRGPDRVLFWAYCRAYRLTGDKDYWRMVSESGRRLGLGNLDQPTGKEEGREKDLTASDWRLIYGLLELADASGADDVRPAMLRRACRVADNLLKTQSPSGLFPRRGRSWARTGDEAPLALAPLAAAIEGKRDRLPPAAFDARFFHGEYDGPLEENQKKRADARTYDNNVFYGDG
jgi:hypothetical protein